jgi:signal transduction histidine kinase
MIEISFNDTGIGISEEDLENLFIIGSSVISKGTEGELSTGLGLILCKEFVEKHGDRIRVTSQLGKGSTFHFTIPVNRPADKAAVEDE